MVICTYCGSENAERNNFCRNCRRQIRCISCKELLEADADMCFVCGENVNNTLPKPSHNTYELDEESSEKTGKSKRKIRISFSDSALDSVAPALSGLIGGVAFRSNSPQQGGRRLFQTSSAATQSSRILESQASAPSSMDEQRNDAPAKITLNSESLLCFELDEDGNLFTTVDDFKGTKQSEQQRRFILIYIIDYQTVFKSSPPDEVVISAAEKNGFYDKNNFKRYLDQMKSDYFVPAGNILQPKDKTQTYLEKIGMELQDSLIKGAPMTAGKRPIRKRATKISFGESEKSKVKELTDKYPIISQINAKGISHRDISAIALYLLKKTESIENINVRILHGVLLSTRNYSTDFKRYRDAIKDRGSEYLHLKSDGNISLTPEGEEAAQKLIADKGFNI